jgi:hypothetical protein
VTHVHKDEPAVDLKAPQGGGGVRGARPDRPARYVPC